jgi:hypothetical protein
VYYNQYLLLEGRFISQLVFFDFETTKDAHPQSQHHKRAVRLLLYYTSTLLLLPISAIKKSFGARSSTQQKAGVMPSCTCRCCLVNINITSSAYEQATLSLGMLASLALQEPKRAVPRLMLRFAFCELDFFRFCRSFRQYQ